MTIIPQPPAPSNPHAPMTFASVEDHPDWCSHTGCYRLPAPDDEQSVDFHIKPGEYLSWRSYTRANGTLEHCVTVDGWAELTTAGELRTLVRESLEAYAWATGNTTAQALAQAIKQEVHGE